MNPALSGMQQSEPVSPESECEHLAFHVYQDVFGGWRWEFRQADGYFVDSKQINDSKEECLAAATKAASTRLGDAGAAVSVSDDQTGNAASRDGGDQATRRVVALTLRAD
jgi:hypothetical protein